jgi:hypothetical protein
MLGTVAFAVLVAMDLLCLGGLVVSERPSRRHRMRSSLRVAIMAPMLDRHSR